MMKCLLYIVISLLIALNGTKMNSFSMNDSKYQSCVQLKRNLPNLNLHCEDLIDSFRSRNVKKVKKDDEEKLKQMLHNLKYN